MTDNPQKPPRVRQRVEAALKTKHRAAGMRRAADEYACSDPAWGMPCQFGKDC